METHEGNSWIAGDILDLRGWWLLGKILWLIQFSACKLCFCCCCFLIIKKGKKSFLELYSFPGAAVTKWVV